MNQKKRNATRGFSRRETPLPPDGQLVYPPPIGDTPSAPCPIVILAAEIPYNIDRITSGTYWRDSGMDQRELVIFTPIDKSGSIQSVWMVRNGTPWRGSILLQLHSEVPAVRSDLTAGTLSKGDTESLQSFVVTLLGKQGAV
jgi:hypothetical protein